MGIRRLTVMVACDGFDMTPIQQYIMRIGNRPQQRYAQNYYDALKSGRASQGVDGPGTSHVMRQATRMAIDEMWEKEFGVRPPPTHESPMRHAAKVEVTMKLSAMKIGQQARVKAQSEPKFDVTWKIDLTGKLTALPASSEGNAKKKTIEFLYVTDDPIADALDKIASKKDVNAVWDWDYQVISVKPSGVRDVSHTYSSTKVVAEDVSKIIEDLIKTEWSGSAEETGRAVSLMKGLAFSDDPKAKKFMQAVDKFTSGLDPKQFA